MDTKSTNKSTKKSLHSERRTNSQSDIMKSLDVLRVDHNKDDETQLPYVIGIVTMALVLSTAAVILRLVTRARILHTFGPDDAFMAAAQILTIGSAIAIYAGQSLCSKEREREKESRFAKELDQ